MKAIVVRRALTPGWVVRLWYRWKHGTSVSGDAQVDLAGTTSWGPGCSIGPFAKVKIRGPLVMGRGVHIGPGSFLDSGESGLSIGDHTVVGANATVVAVTYRLDRLDLPLPAQGTTSKGIRIGCRVHIGPNATVLDGADLGDDVQVAPGAVIAGRVPAGALAVGNPARIIPSTSHPSPEQVS